jgi:hypothetical protein
MYEFDSFSNYFLTNLVSVMIAGSENSEKEIVDYKSI